MVEAKQESCIAWKDGKEESQDSRHEIILNEAFGEHVNKYEREKLVSQWFGVGGSPFFLEKEDVFCTQTMEKMQNNE